MTREHANAYYNCLKLTGVVLSNGLTQISNGTFYNCNSLTTVNFPATIASIGAHSFYNCTSIQTYNFTQHTSLPTLDSSAFTGINSNCMITIPARLYGSWNSSSGWETYKNYIVIEGDNLAINDDSIKDISLIDKDSTSNLSLNIVNYSGATPSISITSSDTAIASISNQSFAQVDSKLHTLNFSVNGLSIGSTNITINIPALSYERTFTVKVVEPSSYVVEAVDGATYGFTLNANGYYESTNQRINSSYSLCKVVITNPGGRNVYFDCINSGENSYDFGILSTLNNTLSSSYNADTTNVKQSFKGLSSTSVQTVDYGAVEGFIYVKFRKDSSSSSGNDSLQFKVRFE